ncbi:hypothetical protein HK097_002730, partial [Rhizophlyctis rosea]
MEDHSLSFAKKDRVSKLKTLPVVSVLKSFMNRGMDALFHDTRHHQSFHIPIDRQNLFPFTTTHPHSHNLSKPFKLTILPTTSSPLIHFTITKPDAKPLKIADLKPTSTRLMHIFFLSSDLETFAHVHLEDFTTFRKEAVTEEEIFHVKVDLTPGVWAMGVDFETKDKKE